MTAADDGAREALADDPETWPNEAIRVLNKAVERAYASGVTSGVADYRQSLRDAAQDQTEQARLCERCSVDLDMLAPEWCSAPSGHRPTADQPDTTAERLAEVWDEGSAAGYQEGYDDGYNKGYGEVEPVRATPNPYRTEARP